MIGWDPSKGPRAQAREQGLDVVESRQEIPGALPTPRVVLMWVPHGAPVDQDLDVLTAGLHAGDVIVDAGKSFWEDSRRRHDALAEQGLHFLDIGTSGGIDAAPGWNAAAFVAGRPPRGLRGRRASADRPGRGCQGGLLRRASPSGHFVKLIDYAIEFGMVQAIAVRFPPDRRGISYKG